MILMILLLLLLLVLFDVLSATAGYARLAPPQRFGPMGRFSFAPRREATAVHADLRTSHRPARYCADFHPQPAWRAAGARALERLDSAYGALYLDAGVYDNLEAVHAALKRIVAVAVPEAVLDRHNCRLRQMAGTRDGGDNNRCDPWHEAQPRGGVADPVAARVVEDLRRHEGLAAAGPLLQPWLPSGEEDVGQQRSSGDGSGSASAAAASGSGGGLVDWIGGRELLDVLTRRRRLWQQGGKEEGEAGGAVVESPSTSAAPEGVNGVSEGDGSDAPTTRTPRGRVLTFLDGTAPLDLDELLLDATDEAIDLAATAADSHHQGRRGVARYGAADGNSSSDASGEDDDGDGDGGDDGNGVGGGGSLLLPVIRLTPELAGRLLQLHPNEGVRWQVYHSGPLRQVRAMLAVMDELTELRRRLAAALGYRCWGDLVLQGGGAVTSAGGGGGGGGGVAGSALGGHAAIVRMLRELGAGLLSYGDSELDAIRRDARRPARGSRGGLPPGADPLDPWNLPFVLQGLAQGQAASRYDTGWSVGYADYFAPPGLLQGSSALCRELFGLALEGPLQLAPGEMTGWIHGDPVPEPEPDSDGGRWLQPTSGLSEGGGMEASQDSEGHDSGGGGGACGGDVVLKAAVVCCRTNRQLGFLYLHLHGGLSEYPFTTLLRHGPMGLSPRTDASVDVERHDARAEPGGEHSLPVVLCGGPESPYFLKVGVRATCEGVGARESRGAGGRGGTANTYTMMTTAAAESNANSTNSDTTTAAVVTRCTDGLIGGSDGDDDLKDDDAVGGRGGWQLALLSGSSCPLDIREVPSHLMEHVLRDPGCVRQLSRHGRLDCPLPLRDCARLVSLLSSCFTSTVGELQVSFFCLSSSSFTLPHFLPAAMQRLVAAALADQIIHGPDTAAQPPPPPPRGVGSPLASEAEATRPIQEEEEAAAALTGGWGRHGGDGRSPGGSGSRGSALLAHLVAHGSVCSLTAHHWRQQQQTEHHLAQRDAPPEDHLGGPNGGGGGAAEALPSSAPPLLVPGPDLVHHLEASAVLGGVQYVYVASRLFAAAVWRAHLQDHLPRVLGGSGGGGQGSSSAAAAADADSCDGQSEHDGLVGGWLVRRRLLEAGAHSPGIEVLRSLLGKDAFVKVPCGDLETEPAAEIRAPDTATAPTAAAVSAVAASEGEDAGIRFSEERTLGLGCGEGGQRVGPKAGSGSEGSWGDANEWSSGSAGPWRYDSGCCWVPDLGADVFQDVDLLG
ncbi:hypothetical protein VOLCADRAFT_88514 [Volvox carteri f. nagariensis]|uniref:Uncharacterized protein n=1 Tax=Volvox carteri f. nagariensis TaxID=3068 RepID=D8TP74_VOLCA|nr:uncharacterized protein VOLCADRAFT_88514 [Volvox carteri f. nagariensis]EFJ50712.1 hypothetical protein VOLCADRAFT_88514 [Volvox carteri f. nagariensis]|eukprot:XP_002948305.1 hypothetical protein VOLCADRAFT_88514 [Volvox carteri f. nagariensis]